jgi:hypothetical protein
LLQMVAVVVVVGWYKHLPPTGYAIGALAVVAAAMSIHIESGLNWWQKTLWMLIIAAFLLVEFRAIDKDRADFAREEACRRKEERESFQQIANTLTFAIQQNQLQFQATMAGIQQSIDSITGGKSFCVVTASGTGSYFILTATAVGKNPFIQ